MVCMEQLLAQVDMTTQVGMGRGGAVPHFVGELKHTGKMSCSRLESKGLKRDLLSCKS